MTFKQKRRYKRTGKIFITLAYAMVVLFFTLIGLTIADVIDIVHSLPFREEISLLLAISPVFLGIIFAGIAQWGIAYRIVYLRMIKRYREYRHFNIILDYLYEGKFKEATDLYNSMPNTYLKDFLYSHMIAFFMLGTNEKRKIQAIEKIGALRETYCHHNINLDANQ